MSEPPLWLTEADVVGLMDLGEAMTALEEGLREQHAGSARNMSKTHLAWESSTLHAIGAVFAEQGRFGAKSWGHTPGGATPLFLLWREDGSLAAVIEAFALGQMRTGGISGVATRWLSAAGADELAVIGSGKQALAQVAAVALVRELRRVRVHSPNPGRRAAFAAKLRDQDFGFEVIEADSVAAAVAGAPIVTTVTRAREPFLTSAMLARGAHINAIGAITPERVEIAEDVVARCDVAAVDDTQAAGKLARELERLFKLEGRVTALASHVGQPRPDHADLTVFKAMGMGISDLSLAVALEARARAQGVGRPFAHPERAAPRLRPDPLVTKEPQS